MVTLVSWQANGELIFDYSAHLFSLVSGLWKSSPQPGKFTPDKHVHHNSGHRTRLLPRRIPLWSAPSSTRTWLPRMLCDQNHPGCGLTVMGGSPRCLWSLWWRSAHHMASPCSRGRALGLFPDLGSYKKSHFKQSHPGFCVNIHIHVSWINNLGREGWLGLC